MRESVVFQVQKYFFVMKLLNEQSAPALQIGVFSVSETAENAVGITV